MIQFPSDFEKPELGPWPVWCNSLIDLGTQVGAFAGKPTQSHKIAIGWELPTQLSKRVPNVGSPMLLRSTMTATMGVKASLRALITGWRGSVFSDDKEAYQWVDESLHKIVGRPGTAMLTLSDNGEHVNVSSVSSAPKPVTFPKMRSEAVFFSLHPLLWNVPSADDIEKLSEAKKASVAEIIKVYGPMKAMFERLPTRTKEKIALSPEFKQLQSGSSPTSQPDVEDNHDDDVPF